ncbi:MAG TPA: elongation factor P maturation arginine rhamnosyltransferase EarP [Burkholderiales bacterium]|nr:elongation factor P maturation arginine rhamnosyltransferase EarP [Burkholderiales bacterium]
MRTPERWDIFCRVVDNFGDAGVCWRLARQLANEYDRRVRLWIDDLMSLKRLVPEVVLAERQWVDGIELNHLQGALSAEVVPAECVVDAFGCGLPQCYLDAMAQSTRKSLWIVLEYLTAEPWARDHHGLPSPHPRLSLKRYFFFPGFLEGTGGLLRERDLFDRRDTFGNAERDVFWRSIGHAPPRADAFTASVFAYENAPLSALLHCWEKGPQEVVVAIPEGGLLAPTLSYFGVHSFPSGGVLRRGALEARLIPFLPQARYDELLWSCDCNFVRGEDSFVRAQWAARPFVWQAYPQAGDAHLPKLQCFLDLYCASLPAAARRAIVDITGYWNQGEATGVSPAPVWAAFDSQRDELRRHGLQWAIEISASGSLVDNLASFCRDKLK